MIDSGRSDNKRIRFLKELGGLLDERGWTRERCLALYRFIEWALLPLDEEKYEEYMEWMRKKEEKKMYVTVAEKIGMEKGMEEIRREVAVRMLDRGAELSWLLLI